MGLYIIINFNSRFFTFSVFFMLCINDNVINTQVFQTVEHITDCTAIGNLDHSLKQDCDIITI